MCSSDLDAMGVDAFVVRHKSSGVPEAITKWTDAVVVNAGDGWHQHPTQALLDAFTITRSFGDGNSMAGRRIAIVGDIKHSRVARSDIDIFTKLGAEVTLVAPGTLLPVDVGSFGVQVANGIDDVIGSTDVLYMLRMQKERMDSALVPEITEYSARFGLDEPRAARLQDHALVMHPGPMNRGLEISPDAADEARSKVLDQVSAGVADRKSTRLNSSH